jgi:hypothetical protein
MIPESRVIIVCMLQEVSWLVDLCRQSIVFEDVDSLACCLRFIIADRDVQVVRVKNRMNPEYNAQQSAGYRDVSLNIRIVNGWAEQLGLSGHVVEVQLLLKSFAELKVLNHFQPSIKCVGCLNDSLASICMVASSSTNSCAMSLTYFFPTERQWSLALRGVP